ncbi:uncharacterized protein LOC126313408 [Schistocerca gregaria]|uniref:uncharacterized protein LOC126313408 n=1 Tax=Schistocerca gregaria TaxID=7010 RepID=UPI00211DB39F|nr:uncharacterized protein LOC126313408 [Schistocerca gregaria]
MSYLGSGGAGRSPLPRRATRRFFELDQGGDLADRALDEEGDEGCAWSESRGVEGEKELECVDGEGALVSDPRVFEGRLSNGTRILLCANEVPVGRVYVQMVVKVGSYNELEEERGCAHLVQHVVFRGTEGYDDKELARFVSSLGARPDADSNATTRYDYTVYRMVVPHEGLDAERRRAGLETAVRMLSEMATGGRMEEWAVSHERGVVLEEGRLRRAGVWGDREGVEEAALVGTEYEGRAPLGGRGFESSVSTCTPERLRRFYEKWYRPENMAVVVVGDMGDTQEVIESVCRHFGGARSEFEEVERGDEEAPNSPALAALRSRDGSRSHLWLLFRYAEPVRRGTLEEKCFLYAVSVLTWLMNSRFNAVVNGNLGRILEMCASESGLTRRHRVLEVRATSTREGEADALREALIEVERLKRHEISSSDLKRVQVVMDELATREECLEQPSDRLSTKLVRRYLYNEPVLSPKAMKACLRRISSGLTSSYLREVARKVLAPGNLLVSASGLEAEVREMMSRVEAQEVAPVVYCKPTSLVAERELRPPGRIESIHRRGSSVILELSNAAQVVVNRVTHREPKNVLGIDLEIAAEGGSAEVWQEGNRAQYDAAVASSLFAKHISIGGICLPMLGFELGVVMKSLDSLLFERKAQFSCFPSCLESMLQVVYCLFTRHPNRWPDERCWEELRVLLDQIGDSSPPSSRLSERALSLNWQDHSLLSPLTYENLRKIDLADCQRWFERAWSNPSEFVFVLTGNFSEDQEDQLFSLLQKYVACIPSKNEEPFFSPKARAQRQLKTIRKVQRTVQFRPRTKEVCLYEGDEGIAISRITFPIPGYKVQLEASLVEVIACALENYLFNLFRNDMDHIHGISTFTLHPFGPLLPGELAVQFSSGPTHARSVARRVLRAIKSLQTHDTPWSSLEVSKALYRQKQESLPPHLKKDDQMGHLFGHKVSNKNLDQILDEDLAKELFHLLLPPDHYTQVTLYPASMAASPASRWTAGTVTIVSALALAITLYILAKSRR